MTLLAIDPGRSFTGTGKARQSIGYACFHTTGGEAERGAISFEELCNELVLWADPYEGTKYLEFAGWRISEIVIEDFVNDPKSARGGQRNGTSECIGAVEILAVQAGVPFTRQRSDVLPAAKLHAPKGSFKDLKHLRHEDSAFLHGREYLIREVDLDHALSDEVLSATM